METFLLVVHILLSFVIVIVILLQSGQGGGMGAGFGGAAAVGQEIFGGRGAATFLQKLTVVLGASFMITSMALAWYSSKPQSLLDLTQGGTAGSQAQVHQIIEEGSGEFRPGDTTLQEIDPSMEGDLGDIPPEILQELQRQMQEGGVDLDEVPSIEEQLEEPVTEQPREAIPGPEGAVQGEGVAPTGGTPEPATTEEQEEAPAAP